MADFINFKERLGMTDHQVLNEILTMREFDKIVSEILSEDVYKSICLKLARRLTEVELHSMGATDEEVMQICDMVDADMRGEQNDS